MRTTVSTNKCKGLELFRTMSDESLDLLTRNTAYLAFNDLLGQKIVDMLASDFGRRDLAQNAWNKLMVDFWNGKKIPDSLDSDGLRKYLIILVKNSILDELRSHGRRLKKETAFFHETSATESSNCPVRLTALSENIHFLRQFLSKLPKNQEEAIVAHYVRGLPLPDYAREAGISANTANSRIRAGLDKLRYMFKEYKVA